MPQHWNAENRAQIVEYLFDLVGEGMSFSAALRLPLMPSASTFASWRSESEVLQSRYVRAREGLADRYVDELIPLADKAVDSDTAAAARVRVETRRWVASKFSQVYADAPAIGAINAGFSIVLSRYDTPRGVVMPHAAPVLNGTLEVADAPVAALAPTGDKP